MQMHTYIHILSIKKKNAHLLRSSDAAQVRKSTKVSRVKVCVCVRVRVRLCEWLGAPSDKCIVPQTLEKVEKNVRKAKEKLKDYPPLAIFDKHGITS